MKSLEYYGSRILRGADLAFTDEREALAPPGESVYRIIEPGSKTYKRSRALFGLIRQSLPESFWQGVGLEKYFRDYSDLPINNKRFELRGRVGSGNQCDCFLLQNIEGKEGIENSFVLKVFQKNGQSLQEVEKKAHQVKTDFETLSSWYKEMPGLIPEQWEVIMPKFQRPHGEPVLTIIQKYLGNKIKDVALGFTDTEWKMECEKHPNLIKELKQFCEITNRNLSTYGRVPDILGIDNLVVASASEAPHLVFLDPDGLDKISDMRPKEKTKVENRLRVLENRANI